MPTFERNDSVRWAGMSASSELHTRRASLDSFSAFTDAMLHLAQDLPGGVTLGQMVFFLSAAQADFRGEPATFGRVRADVVSSVSSSVESTYKVFLDSPRKVGGRVVDGLGWLTAEVDPSHARRKVLRVTAKGAEVVEEVCRLLRDSRPDINVRSSSRPE